ncbi:MAG: hypothetical protein AAGA67_08955, partial [Cyanobacteria bacterium P01_F01_bin.153]
MLVPTQLQQPVRRPFLARALIFGCGVAIALGIVLRFTALDRAVYWYDETITSIRVAGLTKEEVRSPGPEVLERLWSPDKFTAYFFDLSSEGSASRGWDKTLSSLAYENPEQVPLYYLLARGWATLFGNTPFALRGLSALLGVGLLPVVYALVRELGRWVRSLYPEHSSPMSWRTAQWSTTAVVAMSPIQILYAREARGYSLGLLITALSTLAFLKALQATRTRSGNPRARWILYAISLIFGLYTQLPFVLVIITHGIFVWGHRRTLMKSWRSPTPFSRFLGNYIRSCVATLLAFAPWLYFIFTYRQQIGWLNRDLSAPVLLQRWLLNLSAVLFDAQLGFPNQPLFDITASNGDPVRLLDTPLVAIGIVTIVGLIIVSIVWMMRSQPRALWLLPVSWLGTIIPFAALDLLTGGQRSTIPRYFLLSYLGLAIILGWAIAQFWKNLNRQPRLFQFIYGFAAMSLIFSALSSA